MLNDELVAGLQDAALACLHECAGEYRDAQGLLDAQLLLHGVLGDLDAATAAQIAVAPEHALQVCAALADALQEEFLVLEEIYV